MENLAKKPALVFMAICCVAAIAFGIYWGWQGNAPIIVTKLDAAGPDCQILDENHRPVDLRQANGKKILLKAGSTITSGCIADARPAH